MKAYGIWETIVAKEGVTTDEKKQNTTKAIIFQTLPQDVLMQVAQYSTAKEVWDSIKVKHLGADLVQKARLQTLRSELENSQDKTNRESTTATNFFVPWMLRLRFYCYQFSGALDVASEYASNSGSTATKFPVPWMLRLSLVTKIEGAMERYRKLWEHVPSRSRSGDSVPQPISQPTPDDLSWDPSDMPLIYSYDPNIVEEIRRMYWDKDLDAGDAFTIQGFDSWSKKTSLKDHQTEQEMSDYQILLYLSIKTCRFLLKGGCSFRGHDETINSLNRGLFLELYHLLANENGETRMAVERAPLNCTLTSPKIQKQICEYFAKEVLDSILEDIGDDVFSLLVDESSDVSKKEQMAMVFRYLDRHGVVQERFVGVVQVKKTSSVTLKSALDDFFTKHNLSLKQLVVVAVAKNHDGVMKFFEKLMCVVNVVSSSLLKMDESCVAKRNQVARIKNRQYFEIDIFKTVLDMQIQEFGDRFGEISTDLLINMSPLSPRDSFSMFGASKIVTLTTFYRDDFKDVDRFSLKRELDLYYETVIHDTNFMKLKGIAELATLMVTRKKHISFSLIYKLLKFSLLLPVATATVEKCFSANLRNRMGENYLNDALICNIEKEIFAKVTNEALSKLETSKRSIVRDDVLY
ncbi:zinc finger MYM-type protein 1-like protein [Tanacetum coccineum]